jgi:two-component system, OmpR family, KDP operon response regulator KdpE
LSNTEDHAGLKKVLVVNPDPETAQLLQKAFSAGDFEVAYAATSDAITLAMSWRPLLILLELNSLNIDVSELIRKLRMTSNARILAMSTSDGEREKRKAFELGANDLVGKSFRPTEILARARSLLQSCAAEEPAPAVFHLECLSIDGTRQMVMLQGRALNFTFREFQVLNVLAKANGRVVSPRELIEAVWGAHMADRHQYLRVFIGRMRAKIEEDPRRPKFLLTERGSGYRLAPGGGLPYSE